MNAPVELSSSSSSSTSAVVGVGVSSNNSSGSVVVDEGGCGGSKNIVSSGGITKVKSNTSSSSSSPSSKILLKANNNKLNNDDNDEEKEELLNNCELKNEKHMTSVINNLSSASSSVAPTDDDHHHHQSAVVAKKPSSSSNITTDSTNTNCNNNSDYDYQEPSTSTGTWTNSPAGIMMTNSVEAKQEEPATVSSLSEGELKALLDETITYKRPKDREGKSSLFKELLEEVEADETEERNWTVTNSRCLPGSNRRRNNKRADTVSERLTHGGSLQNLAQPINSEFDASFAYLTSGSNHNYKQGRRKGNKKHSGSTNVSARQREGGSLPSNVNATHTLSSGANFDLAFDKKKVFLEEKPICDWSNRDKLSKPDSKPSQERYFKKEEKERKESHKPLSNCCDNDSTRVNLGTNEMLESDNPPPEYKKQECMVIDVDDLEKKLLQASTLNDRNASATLGAVQRPRSLDAAEEEEGTEMKTIENRRAVQFITRATFDIPQLPSESPFESTLRDNSSSKLEKSKLSVNGTEGTGSLPYPSYNNVKCVMSGPSSVYSVMSWPSNISMVSRLTAQHISGKDSLSGDKKALDENGNAVQGHQGERKKARRKNTQEPNVIVYKAENVEGHRDDKDIDVLLSFIENKEFNKTKKGSGKNSAGNSNNNSVKVNKTTSNSSKSRSRNNKDIKREDISKLQKSNSLEEISKTKLEDLTAEKEASTSSGASSVSSQHAPVANVSLRRVKQRSIGDSSNDCRGDRRSWGTEEGQSIYCNDIGDDYNTNNTASRQNLAKKNNVDSIDQETEFHVVTNKKKKTKRQQRRSCSGSRAQNSTSNSYLQRGRNEYRNCPLSPELRRKSASSMPPSDKSDSSDLDSVHSLPVTSNNKNIGNSSSAPQASYAQIARMAANPILNTMSNAIPSVINATAWPSVVSSKANSNIATQSTKASADTEKSSDDYYPSLDELQHPEMSRKQRQHNSSTNNSEKFTSPSATKSKEPSKKLDDREESSNSSPVVMYVQDIEKMHHQESGKNSSNSSSPSNNVTNEQQASNSSNTNSNNSVFIKSLPSTEQSATCNATLTHSSDNNSDDNSNVNKYPQSVKNNPRDSKKSLNFYQHEDNLSRSTSSHLQQDEATADLKKQTASAGPTENTQWSSSKTSSKPCNTGNNNRTMMHNRSLEMDSARLVNKTEKSFKAKEQGQAFNKDSSAKVSFIFNQQPKTYCHNKEVEDTDIKKQPKTVPRRQESKERQTVQQTTDYRNSALTSRPPVILLDENFSDQITSSDASSEFTFGFEINEELLLSEEDAEEDEETPMVSPDLTSHHPVASPTFNQQQLVCEKYPSVQVQPNQAFVQASHAHHSIHSPHVVVSQVYGFQYHPMGTPVFQEKPLSQTKEDFAARYVAPEEVNVQHNHDKIVNFVGLAWDDIMREMPAAASSSSRVQYYNGE